MDKEHLLEMVKQKIRRDGAESFIKFALSEAFPKHYKEGLEGALFREGTICLSAVYSLT